MLTRTVVSEIGGEWEELQPIVVGDIPVDVWQTEIVDGSAQVLLYDGIVHVRIRRYDEETTLEYATADIPEVKRIIDDLR